MATQLGHPDSSDPADLTAERFRAALRGEGNYPRDAVFIDAEASFAWDATVRNIREERPVVLVFPDGLEKVIVPSSPERREQAGVVATARRLGSRFNPTRLLG
jgi:hypothetical protein